MAQEAPNPMPDPSRIQTFVEIPVAPDDVDVVRRAIYRLVAVGGVLWELRHDGMPHDFYDYCPDAVFTDVQFENDSMGDAVRDLFTHLYRAVGSAVDAEGNDGPETVFEAFAVEATNDGGRHCVCLTCEDSPNPKGAVAATAAIACTVLAHYNPTACTGFTWGSGLVWGQGVGAGAVFCSADGPAYLDPDDWISEQIAEHTRAVVAGSLSAPGEP